ncbi:MAG: hypothetical protein WCG42_07030, partial [Parachlamydiaceae bacterium]
SRNDARIPQLYSYSPHNIQAAEPDRLIDFHILGRFSTEPHIKLQLRFGQIYVHDSVALSANSCVFRVPSRNISSSCDAVRNVVGELMVYKGGRVPKRTVFHITISCWPALGGEFSLFKIRNKISEPVEVTAYEPAKGGYDKFNIQHSLIASDGWEVEQKETPRVIGLQSEETLAEGIGKYDPPHQVRGLSDRVVVVFSTTVRYPWHVILGWSPPAWREKHGYGKISYRIKFREKKKDCSYDMGWRSECSRSITTIPAGGEPASGAGRMAEFLSALTGNFLWTIDDMDTDDVRIIETRALRIEFGRDSVKIWVVNLQ